MFWIIQLKIAFPSETSIAQHFRSQFTHVKGPLLYWVAFFGINDDEIGDVRKILHDFGELRQLHHPGGSAAVTKIHNEGSVSFRKIQKPTSRLAVH